MKVYKTNISKSNPGIVIIYITQQLTESEHQTLENLIKTSDLFFIFPKSVLRSIDPYKFSNLYRAVWYGVAETNNRNEDYWQALDYLQEFGGYCSLTVMTQFSSPSKEDLDALIRLQRSGIEKAVFSSRELGREEKKGIYTVEPKIFELFFGIRFKWFGKYNHLGAYSTQTSDDSIFFLRPNTIEILRGILNRDILDSFAKSDFQTFISSVIPPKDLVNLHPHEARV